MRDTIDMAREAGLIKTVDCCGVPDKFCGQDEWKGNLKAFEALVRADEREACAKVCEDTPWSNWFTADCAAAIRARGNT
jgi:hypothetical protein